MKRETLRARLKRLAAFTDADFVAFNGMASVLLLQEPETESWHLVGASGRTVRTTIIFHAGLLVDFGVPLPMEIVDQGTVDGDPVLVLALRGLPGVGTRRWSMRYFCQNVDTTGFR